MFSDCFTSIVGSSTYERNADVAASMVLSQNCQGYAEQSRAIRSAFTELELSDLPVVAGHTHGKSAAARSSASAFIDVLGPAVGKRSVFLQGSSADAKKGRVYTRHYRWGKDLVVAPSQVDKGENDLTAMIDVDYYVDMPDHLSRNFRPLVLYTFQPSRAGKSEGEYKYCFLADGRVRYTVSGGGEYCHEVWNWKGDSVSAQRTVLGCIPITYSVFSIERRNVDEDHQLVLLTPLMKFKGPFAWLAKRRAQSETLQRLNPVDGNFVRLRINGPDGMLVSTSRVGGYLSANVSVGMDEAIASASNTTARITHGTVRAKMATTTDGKGDFTGSEILLEYHLRGEPTSDRIDLSSAVRSYQWVKNYQDYEPEKPAMQAFMKPLYDGAFVPDNCRNNDVRMVEERVLKQRHTPAKMSPFLNTVMMEFIEIFKEHTGVLTPVDQEVVYEKQNKPSQRRILEEAQHGMSEGKSSIFKKNEAYGSVTDPRAISQIEGKTKLEYSQITYALSAVMDKFRWYAFGRTPREIALIIAEICTAARSHLDSTDFERQDGKIDSLVRFFEKALMLAIFHPDYHIRMLQLMRDQTGLRAKTTFGVKYNTMDARASGSPETSLFNTILNAFIAFLGFRMTRVNGRFLTAREAWSRLGIYGGDDGATADQDRRAAEKAATMMGQVMTCERTLRGQLGVTFLARHYGPDVWYDAETPANSCCDIRRQLAKFHVTVHLSGKITPKIKLQEKAFAFYLCDRNTPVIGDFVKKALEHFPMKRQDYQNHLMIWNSNIDESSHYPNEYEGWMTDLLVKQIPEFDYVGFWQWLDQTTPETIFCPPRFAPPAPTNPKKGLVVVDGDFEGEVTKSDASIVSTSDSIDRKKRRHRPRKSESKWRGKGDKTPTAKGKDGKRQ
nr:MAG: hypothetical protein [Yunnan sediment noda-like virus 1]